MFVTFLINLHKSLSAVTDDCHLRRIRAPPFKLILTIPTVLGVGWQIFAIEAKQQPISRSSLKVTHASNNKFHSSRLIFKSSLPRAHPMTTSTIQQFAMQIHARCLLSLSTLIECLFIMIIYSLRRWLWSNVVVSNLFLADDRSVFGFDVKWGLEAFFRQMFDYKIQSQVPLS